MRTRIYYLLLVFGLVYGMILLNGCISEEQSESFPTLTPQPQIAQNEHESPGPKEVFMLEERPGPVWVTEFGVPGQYLTREFLQLPEGMDWGVDGYLYVADSTGGHVVIVDNDGPIDDLGLWRTSRQFQLDGPMGVAVDSTGIIYIHNHAHIFRLDLNGEVTDLRDRSRGILGAPIGGIALGHNDELYFTDRSDQGGVYLWNPAGYSEKVADLPYANGLAVGLDGIVYAGQLSHNRIVSIDVEKKEVTDFVSVYIGPELIFLDVDSSGNLWARVMGALHQYSPHGKEIPFFVDGVRYPGGRNIWDQSKGLAFDDSGNLWVGSGDSRLMRLDLISESDKEKHFSFTLVSPGLEPWDLASGNSGEVYATDINQNELIRFGPSGDVDIIASLDGGYAAVAVDPYGSVFFTMPGLGEIKKLDPDSSLSSFATLRTPRMVFADDGNLYAVVARAEDMNTIVRVEEGNIISTVASQIDGIPLGSGFFNLCAASGKGLYLYSAFEQNLFLMNYDGTGNLIANLGHLTHPGGPYAMACSPTSGDIYLIFDYGYRIDAKGNITKFVRSIYGDPWGATISRDGKWLYVAEAGAINKIPLTED